MKKHIKKILTFTIVIVLFLMSIFFGSLYLSKDKNAGLVRVSNAYLSKYSTKLEGNIINIDENNKGTSKGYDEVNYIVSYNLSEEPGIDTRPVDIVATLDENERYAIFKGTNQNGVRSELSTDMKILTIHVDNASTTNQNNIQITMLIEGAPNGYTITPKIKIKEATEENYTNVEVTAIEVKSNSLRGKVTDEKNMSVSDILVSLRKNGRLIKETYTKADGTYSFSDIDKDTYEVVINEDIYESINKNNVKVEEDAALNIKVKQVEPYNIEVSKFITKLKLKNDNVEEVYNYGEITFATASIKKIKNIGGEIFYKVTVENKGKKSGIVTVVKDELPEGLSFDKKKNDGWELVDGVMYNRDLEGITLSSGEKREETLILDIQNTNEAKTYINKITAKGEIYEKVVFLINGTKYKEKEVLEGEKIKEPETGLTNLDGWYTDPEFTNKYNFNLSVTKDLILYSRTVTEKCKVTFMDYGKIWDEQKIDCGSSPRRPSNPVHEGYDLKCWKTSGGCIDFDDPIEEDTIIESSYNLIIYNINYNLDGGSLGDKVNPSTYTVETDTFTLNNPSKTYYDFIGWTGSNGEEVEETVTIEKGSTGNKNYKANYRKQKVNVKFVDDGEIISDENVDKGSIIQPLEVSKTGYTFKFWSKDNVNEFNFNNPILENTVLYSVYEINKYNVEFYNGDTLLKTLQVEYNNLIDQNEAPTVEKEGYTFTFWSLKNENEGYDFTTRVTKNIKLFSNFVKQKKEVIFNDENRITEVQVEWGDTVSPISDKGKVGYTFSHWSLNISGSPFDFTTPITSLTTLYAVYNINTYTLNYNLAGGSLGDKTNPSTYTIETDTFTLNNPSKTGYRFTGWSENNEELYNPKIIEKGSTGNKTFKANYEPIIYEINYELNDGVLEEDNPIIYTIETDTFTLNNPSKTGYKFTGWTGTGLSEKTTSVSILKGSTGDRNYEAHFEKIYFNVTFFDKDPENPSIISQIGEPVVVAYGDKVNEKDHPVHTGYNPDGWFDDDNHRYSFDLPVTSNINLTANYKKKKYNVTFIDEGEQYASYKVEYKDLVTKPSDPDRTSEHKLFKGWLLNNEIYNFNTPVTSDIELISSYEVVEIPSLSYSPTTWTNSSVLAEVTSSHENYSYKYKIQEIDDSFKDYNTQSKIVVGDTYNCLPTLPCYVIAKSIYNGVSSETASKSVNNIERINPLVKSLEATNIDINNATISVKTQDNESGMDYIKIYLNDIYQADISYNNNKIVDEDSSKTEEKISTYTFDNLESDTTYEVQIVAFDAAGNQTTSEKIEFTTMEEEEIVAILIAVNNVPIEEITKNEQFSKLKKAIEDPRCVSQQCTIQMVADTSESVSVLNGQDITLDINGHTITGVRDYTIDNEGLLTIIDDGDTKGIITNTNLTSLKNENDGILTLGVNEDNGIPSSVAPNIYGAIYAVENNGIFRFYDGRLEGRDALSGIVDDTPYSYNATTTTTDESLVITLKQIDDPEARIGSVYYTKTQTAVDEAANGQRVKKTNLLKGFSSEEEYKFIFNDETNNLESNNNIANTTAISTEIVDLSEFALDQTLFFTARIENSGEGSITVTEIDDNNELLSNLSTSESVSTDEKEITFKLLAGKKYLVTLEYNSSSEYIENSKMVVSNMVLAEYKEDLNKATNPETAAIKNYGFRYDSETHELKSDNQFVSPSRAFSYMEIDLTNETNNKDLLINAYLETYKSSSISGYIVIDETLDIPKDSGYYPSNSNSIIAKIGPSESYSDSFVKIGPYNYIRTLSPGKKYYLSFVFQKSIYSNYPSMSDFDQNDNKDQFIIKSIDLVDSIDDRNIDLSTELITAEDSDFSYSEMEYQEGIYELPEIENTRSTDPDIQNKLMHSYIVVDLTNKTNDMTALMYIDSQYYNFYGVVTDNKNLPNSDNAFVNALNHGNGIYVSDNSKVAARLIGGRKNYIHFVYDIGEEVTAGYYYAPRIGNIKLINASLYDLNNSFVNYSGSNYVKDSTDSYKSSSESYSITSVSQNSVNDSAVMVDLTNSSSDQYARLKVNFKYYNEKYIYITTDESYSGANHFMDNPKDSLIKYHNHNSPDRNYYSRNKATTNGYIDINYVLPKGNKYYIHFVTKWGTTSNDQTHDSFEINYLLLSPIINHDVDIGELTINKVKKPPASLDGIILEDETVDKNTRFVSLSTSNYITFNNEMWRIIGIFNTEDGNGNTARRIKIVRNDSIGNYSFDGSASNLYGVGTNDWSQSDLMQLLNPNYESESVGGSLYWNKQSGNCYTGSNSTSACDFSSFGLSSDARALIDEVKWSTGMIYNPNSITSNLNHYNVTEKSSTWLGKVGLPLLSDYIFAADSMLPNNTMYTRESCINGNLGAAGGCVATNDWLHNMINPTTSLPVWTMTGSNMTPPAFLVNGINSVVGVGTYTSFQAYKVFPTVYLSTKTHVTGGKGTIGNPYTIELGTSDNEDEYYGLISTASDEEDDSSIVPEEETDDYQEVTTKSIYGFKYEGNTKSFVNLNQNDPYTSAAYVFEFDMTNETEETKIELKYDQISYSPQGNAKSFVNLYPDSFVSQDYTIVNYNDYKYGLQSDNYISGTTSGSYSITLAPGTKYYLQVVFNTTAINDTYRFSITGEKYDVNISTYIPELNKDPDRVELLKDVVVLEALDIIDTRNVILDLNGHTLANQSGGHTIDNKGSLKIIDSKYVNDKNSTESEYNSKYAEYITNKSLYDEYYNSYTYIVDNNYKYTYSEPGVQTFVAPKSALYKLEVWGAEGGYTLSSDNGGNGGYASGEIELQEGEVLKVYVGASGNNGGYNGGGSIANYPGGGGATDIRIEGDTLYNRIIVAGGGGGEGSADSAGGVGGGKKGQTPSLGGIGGSDTTGYEFGQGENGTYSDNQYTGAGGGGWYGGYASTTYYYAGGGGGSGFVYNGSNTVPSNYAVINHSLTNTLLKDGKKSIPTHDGSSTMIGNEGDGYATISIISEDVISLIETIASTENDYPVKEKPVKPEKEVISLNGKVNNSYISTILNEENAMLDVESALVNCNASDYSAIENYGSVTIGSYGEAIASNGNGIYSLLKGDILNGSGYVSSFKVMNNDTFAGYTTDIINMDKNLIITANNINSDNSKVANVIIPSGTKFNSTNSTLHISDAKENSISNISNSLVSFYNVGNMTITSSVLRNDFDSTNDNILVLNDVSGSLVRSSYDAESITITESNINIVNVDGGTANISGLTGNELNTLSSTVLNYSNVKVITSTDELTGTNVTSNSISTSGESSLNNLTVKDGKIVVNSNTLTISGGSITSSTDNNVNTEAILVKDNANLIILDNFEIKNYDTGIKTNLNSILTLGSNLDEVKNDIIIRGNNEGIVNTKRGTFNYYDGMIISDKDNVIKSPINSTPDDYDLDETIDGSIKTVFLSRYDNPNRDSVARIENTEYKSLKSAFDSIVDASDTQIDLLKNIDTVISISVPENRNITLNLNGKNINTLSKDLIVNNGNLDIDDYSSSSDGTVYVYGNSFINNSGYTSINTNVTASTPYNRLLINSGELVINGGNYNIPFNDIDIRNSEYLGNYNGILKNTGHTIIFDGEFNNSNNPLYDKNYLTDNYCNNEQCRLLYNTGTLDVYDGTFNSIIRLYGTNNISGGTFNNEFYSTKTDFAEENNSFANTNITGGNFDSWFMNDTGCTMVIDGVNLLEASTYNSINNYGNMTIVGSTIDRYVNNYSDMEIVSGNFTKQLYNEKNLIIDDIYLDTDLVGISANNNNSSIIIKSGNIISNKSHAIDANGYIKIGEDDGDIKVKPFISGKTVGINTASDLSIDFYDGYVRGQAAIALTVVVNDKPADVDIITDTETIDNVDYEIKYLGNASLLKNTRSLIEYDDFQTAIDEAQNGETIQLLRTYILPSDLETIVIDSSKDISIDMNGFSLSKQNSNLLFNNEGTLSIYSKDKNVTIASAYKTNFINNSGTLYIENVDLENANGSMDPSNTLIYNSGNLDMINCNINGHGNDTILNNTSIANVLSGKMYVDGSGSTLVNTGTFKSYSGNYGSLKGTAVTNSGIISFEPKALYYYDKQDEEKALSKSIGASKCTKASNDKFTCVYNNTSASDPVIRYCYEKDGEIKCESRTYIGLVDSQRNDYYYGTFDILSETENKKIILTFNNVFDVLSLNRDSFITRSSYDTNIYGGEFYSGSGHYTAGPNLIKNTNKLTLKNTAIDSSALNVVINSTGNLDVGHSRIREIVDAKYIYYDQNDTNNNIDDFIVTNGTSKFDDVIVRRVSSASKTNFSFNEWNIPIDKWAIKNNGNITINKLQLESKLNAGIYSTNGTINITDSEIKVGYLSNRQNSPYKSDRIGIKVDSGTISLKNTDINTNITALEFNGTSCTINGGNIDSIGYGYYNQNNRTETPAIQLNSGTTNLVSGTINSTYGQGIVVDSNATLNVGKQDGNVSIVNPEISGTASSSYVGLFPALDSNGTVNIYDGVFKSSDNKYGQIKGSISSLESNYSIVKNNNSKYLGIDDLIKIEKSSSDIRYYNDFNSAISDASNGDTLELLREFTQLSTDSVITIPTGLNITIDLNGNKYIANSENSIVNNGNLSIINGSVVSTSNYYISNNGTLNLGDDNNSLVMTDVNILNNSLGTLNYKAEDLLKIDNYGTLNVKSGTLHELNNVSGVTTIEGGSIIKTTREYAIMNSATLNILGGVVTNTCKSSNDPYCHDYAINNNIGAIINITNNAIIDKTITNNGELYTNNYCTNGNSSCSLIINESKGTIGITNSIINNTDIHSESNMSVSNSTLGAVVSNGNLTVDNNSIIVDLVTSCNTSITNSSISYLTNNCNDKTLVSLNSVNVTGKLTNNGSIILDGNTIESISTTSGSYTEFISGTVNKGFNNNGTLIIGSEGGNVSTTDPMISGTLTTSVYGEAYFYDGVIKGNNEAVSGLFTEIEPGYTLKSETDIETGLQVVTLKLIGPDDARIAVVAGLNFDKIQSAVNYAANNNINAIVLYADITLDSDLVIPSSKTATIYLNGYTITENGYTIDSNITISNDPAPQGANILSSILGAVSKNVIVYEMEDGSSLSPERTYKLYKLKDGNYELVKMKREEEIGRYSTGSFDIDMKTVRSRIYLNNLSDGNYKLIDNHGKEISFVIDDTGIVSPNVLEYYDSSVKKHSSSAIATLVIAIKTGISRINFILILLIILILLFMLFLFKRNKLKNSKEA